MLFVVFLARRGGRRGGGRFADEEQESSQSTGVTLFDYVENKMTASGSKREFGSYTFLKILLNGYKS